MLSRKISMVETTPRINNNKIIKAMGNEPPLKLYKIGLVYLLTIIKLSMRRIENLALLETA